jgi:predicted O-methyltransferase YrrM
MSHELWQAVDRYLVERLVPPDDALTEALTANAAAELPAIDVSPNLGKLLHLLARMQRAERILEIGTLGGYSTIWLARALPPAGKLITLELQTRHAEVALANIKRAGLASQVDLRVGRALDSLESLARERAAPFDFVFIDADKQGMADYVEWAIRLSRPGTVIVCDNVIRRGAILDPETVDESVQGVRRFLEMAGKDRRLDVTALQTVGLKGHDGFALAIVNG